MKKEFIELKMLIQEIEDELSSLNFDEEEIEAKYYDAEAKLEDIQNNNYDDLDLSVFDSKMKFLRDELNIYNPEDELDNMYPNRHDEGFDEDQISGESFFKD